MTRVPGSGGELDLGAALPFLRERISEAPRVLLVLGSGLGRLADLIDGPLGIQFAEIPGFPGVGVAGHSGRLVVGCLAGVPVLAQSGRFHMYEGHPPEVVVAPARIAAELGVEVAIITNAAGAVNRRIGPGDLMLVDDHINLMWRNPLVGPVPEGESRFPDMSAPYDPGLQRVALESAGQLGVRLARGTYVAMLGPSYETPAEIRMVARLGGDVVGMSTVPEVLALRARNVRVLAFSLVTNRAAGTNVEPLSHAEVMAVAEQAGAALGNVIESVVRTLRRHPAVA